MAVFLAGLLAAATYILPVAAQLSGSVGPTTTTAHKAAVKICNIMDYGGVAKATADNGAAIQAAWTACKSGGQVYIPKGDYGLSTWLTLKSGTGVSINLEGIIYRTGTGAGNMIMVRDTTDFEFYSATSAGAIQGYGYEFHKNNQYGPRILRLYNVKNFSVHDIALVDSPAFHLSLDTCTNGELYNMIIRGANEGGLDGIDVWSTNIWIHDIEVTNKDECVTVKSPADHILVEQVHCNWSGGCAMGSLGSGVDVHDIEYRDIYTHSSNQMFMIKSNGGSGNVYNVAFNNFVGHSNAYSLDFDTAWSSMSAVAGSGINYSNISFNGWTGTCNNGAQRGPIKMNCPAGVPCTDISVKNFNMWTETGSKVLYGCQNAYGSGACLNNANAATAYTSTQTLTTASNYAYSTMANELTAGLGLTASIAIPTMPASFFPGKAPISAILGKTSGNALPVVTTTHTSAAAASTRASISPSTHVTSTAVAATSPTAASTKKSSSSSVTLATSTRTATTTKSSSSSVLATTKKASSSSVTFVTSTRTAATTKSSVVSSHSTVAAVTSAVSTTRGSSCGA